MAVNSKQAMGFSNDSLEIEEFVEDMFETSDMSREEYDRRNSLGGGSIFRDMLAPAESSNTYM